MKVPALTVSPERVALAYWARPGERTMAHGADAVRYLGLSTQVALLPI